MVFRARRFLPAHSLELRTTADRLSLRDGVGIGPSIWQRGSAPHQPCTPQQGHSKGKAAGAEGRRWDRGIRDMTGTSVSASCPGDPLRL